MWKSQHHRQKLRPLSELSHGSYPRGKGKLWDLEKIKKKNPSFGIWNMADGRIGETGKFFEKA